MAKYYKTWYGYRSHDGDGFFATMVSGIILIGAVIWLCSKLFIPLVIIDVFYLLYRYQNKTQLESIKVPIILGIATVVTGVCFFATLNDGKETAPSTSDTTLGQQDEIQSDSGKADTPSENQSDSNQQGTSTPAENMNSAASTPSSPSSSSSTCLHYEAGRCWDDLEVEAYSQGQYDKYYGNYGDSYYESDECDQLCQDILEDAYEQGYDEL